MTKRTGWFIAILSASLAVGCGGQSAAPDTGDGATGQDVVSTSDTLTPPADVPIGTDTPTPPTDVPVGADVPVGVDVPVAMDVPVGTDVPTSTDASMCDTRAVADSGTIGLCGRTPTLPPSMLPNLQARLSAPLIESRTFATSSCEIAETCIGAPGTRRLLRFTLTTPNVGADLYLGPPTAANRPASMFEYGACHRHYHLRGYADYRLTELASSCNREVGNGHKASFCLEDFGPRASMPGAYTCSDQGIHSGSYDIYDRGLPCQWIDITDVPPGRYRITARINTECAVEESNYADNAATLDVDIP